MADSVRAAVRDMLAAGLTAAGEVVHDPDAPRPPKGAPPARWRLIEYDDAVDQIDPHAAVLMVYRANVRPNGFGGKTHEMNVRLLSPSLVPGKSDDDLDPRLDQVLAVVDACPFLTWTNAERGVFADEWPAYVITLTTTTPT